MSNHTAVWQEFNASQREYYRALSEQNRVQERFMPVSRDRDPDSPVRLPAALTLEAIEELAAVDRQIHESRQRYARAINAVHDDM